jgi:hypothetical protein
VKLLVFSWLVHFTTFFKNLSVWIFGSQHQKFCHNWPEIVTQLSDEDVVIVRESLFGRKVFRSCPTIFDRISSKMLIQTYLPFFGSTYSISLKS